MKFLSFKIWFECLTVSVRHVSFDNHSASFIVRRRPSGNETVR